MVARGTSISIEVCFGGVTVADTGTRVAGTVQGISIANDWACCAGMCLSALLWLGLEVLLALLWLEEHGGL